MPVALKNAARLTGVKSIIMGGAGLAGYAEVLQASCPVSLIDSASAGLRVLLEKLAPAAQRETNGFGAVWSGVSPEMLNLKASHQDRRRYYFSS